MDWKPLMEAAAEARKNSYSPYSKFAVGAAILTDDGRIFAGCNIENRTFGLTMCAERVAIGAAVAQGATKVVAAAVITDASPPSTPCGLCRETLAEFGDANLPVALGNTNGELKEHRLADLLPHPFEFEPK